MSYFLKTRSNVVLTYISYPLRKLNNANCRRELSSLLTIDKRTQAINNLSRNGFFPWSEINEGKCIAKNFEFADFSQAWSFMSRSALLAEQMEHHPTWLNMYNRVEVKLTTHDCGGVSEKDIAMAESMDQFASDLMPFKDSFPSTPTSIPDEINIEAFKAR